MGVPSVDWLAIAPWLLPGAGSVVLLGADALLPRRLTRGRVLDVLAVLLLLAALVTLVPLADGTRATFCATADRCSYVAGHLTFAVQLVVLAAAVVCLLLALADRTLPRVEQLVLLLAATAGACALAGARDLATLAVALETASLPLVGLVALRRDGRGAEAGLKLLLTSVLSFGLLALGIALVYASTGSLHLGTLPSSELGDLRVVHGLGLALVVAGAAFKLSLVPFHLWTPDTYAGAPLPVAAFLSTVSKAAGLTAVVLVLAVGAPERSVVWAAPVGAVAAVTMTVGNLVALRQQTALRLLAWSTVAQAGWVLLPLAGAVGAGRIPGAVSASLAYLLAYAVATLTAFAVLARESRRHPDGPRHRLAAYAGLWRSQPALALVLTFALLCLAGLPPGVMGVVAKVVALVPVVGVEAWWLVAVAVVNVVLGVAVYLRWAVQLFTPAAAAPDAAADVPADGPRSPVSGRVALSVAAAGCVALSVLPEGLIGLLAGTPLR
ncbi:NADH-quinone oxidoreductase subunit N [Angustibacter peucedani]